MTASRSTRARWRWIGMASGIVYVLLWLSSSFFWAEGPNTETASVEQIVVFLEQQQLPIGIGASMGLLAFGALLIFLAHLHHALQQVEESFVLPAIAYAGGVLTVGLFLAGIALAVMPLLLELEQAAPSVIQTVYVVSRIGNEALGDVTTITRAVLIGAAALAMLRSTRFPRWIGWLGIGIALLSLLASLFPLAIGGVGFVWFVAFMLFPVWVLLTSFVLGRSAKQPAAVSAVSEALAH